MTGTGEALCSPAPWVPPVDEFADELSREDLRLARACLLLARDVRPGVDPDAYLARVDPWAERVRALARETDFPTALRLVLAVEEGFRGSVEDYHDPDNSFLDRVMERRRGLPIMLSILYLEVARRLGEPLVAVGFPGHFLVRYEDRLMDPFMGGAPVAENDLQRLLDRVTGGHVPVSREMLRATPDRDVLARVLANLKNAYVMENDARAALRIEDRILQLNPFAFPEYRDRGLLRSALGDLAGAREDLARYVEAMPKAPDADAVRRLLARL